MLARHWFLAALSAIEKLTLNLDSFASNNAFNKLVTMNPSIPSMVPFAKCSSLYGNQNQWSERLQGFRRRLDMPRRGSFALSTGDFTSQHVVYLDACVCRCGCGRQKEKHFYLKGGCVPQISLEDKWNVGYHTELQPTDAYGTIEFQGGPHPTKAQVRLSLSLFLSLFLSLCFPFSVFWSKFKFRVVSQYSQCVFMCTIRKTWRNRKPFGNKRTSSCWGQYSAVLLLWDKSRTELFVLSFICDFYCDLSNTAETKGKQPNGRLTSDVLMLWAVETFWVKLIPWKQRETSLETLGVRACPMPQCCLF